MDLISRWMLGMAALFLVVLVGCEKKEELLEGPDQAINVPENRGHDLLSSYNFFTGEISDLVPNESKGVLPYDLNTPLFSDYAAKKRFVYVPENAAPAPYTTEGPLDFPVGTVLIKHFYYPGSSGEDLYVETRLLIRRAGGWQPEIYEWNEAQTDAERTIVGGTRPLTVTLEGEEVNFNYLIPNKNQCKNCHENEGSIQPVGPVVANLNKTYNYPSGTMNQLDMWTTRGILSSATAADIPKWPQIDDAMVDIDTRARAYLDVNCSSCHSRKGSAANSGLYLEFENRDSLSLGVFKTPVAAGDGSGGLRYVIHPGKADESILLFRMQSDVPDERMPEIGRSLPHDEGIALIKAWIDSM